MTTPPVPSITDELLAEIESAAQAATGGEWEYRLGLIRTLPDSYGYVPIAVAPNSPKNWRGQRDINMQYIAMAMPSSMLALITRLRAAEAEIVRLSQIINTPQADDFLRAVSTEAEHQRQRWGSAHDEGKAPADWFWLVGYLAGKALHAHGAGNVEKAEHHVITTAAALANWHRAMFGKTNMRPGIGDTAMERNP